MVESDASVYDFLFKIALVGDSSVGKTSLMRRFTDNEFDVTTQKATIGVQFSVMRLPLHSGKIAKLQVWDTAGQERYRAISAAYYRGAHAVLIVFDMTSKKSFDNVQYWFNEVKTYTAQISKMSEKANLIGMKIQAMILQSYVELSQLQIEVAKSLIDEAKLLSEKYEIRYFPVAMPDDERLSDAPKTETKGYTAGSLEVKQSINKIIHSLPRLRIIFYLYDKPFATFMEMKETLGFSPGKLGKHCDHLTEVGYLDKRKEFDGNKYVTAYRITPLGSQEFRTYAEALKYQLQAVSLN